MNDQFLIIEKNLDNNSIPNRDKWIDTIRSCKKLGDKLNIINIPMLCTYTDDIYEKFNDMNDSKAMQYHEVGIRELKNILTNKIKCR